MAGMGISIRPHVQGRDAAVSRRRRWHLDGDRIIVVALPVALYLWAG